MDKLKQMEDKIQELRYRMYKLIEQKTILIDPEIVNISQELDKLLNLYNEIKEEHFWHNKREIN